MNVSRAVVVVFTLAVLPVACRKAEVTAYQVPKEKEREMPAATAAGAPMASPASPSMPGGPMSGTAVATADGPSLTWTAPTGWKAKPGMPMRKATYTITTEGGGEAELAITAFPNMAGVDLANLNRWRGQVQLPPVGEAELASAFTRFEHDGLKFAVVDLNGSQRLLAAVVPFSGAAWFFKLTGPDAIVAKAKPAFMDFLSSVKPAPSTP